MISPISIIRIRSKFILLIPTHRLRVYAMIGKGVDKEEFVRRVNAMDLSLPAKIHVAVSTTTPNQ
jgi:hypothetical protein